MGCCRFKRFHRTRVCSGDLINYISLQQRELQPPPLTGGEPPIDFTTIKSVWSAIETTRGTRRFSGVNIEDEATHLFYVRYDSDFFPLDGDNFFVEFASRRYRILRVTEHNEDRLFLIIQCKETGESSKDGSKS